MKSALSTNSKKAYLPRLAALSARRKANPFLVRLRNVRVAAIIFAQDHDPENLKLRRRQKKVPRLELL